MSHILQSNFKFIPWLQQEVLIVVSVCHRPAHGLSSNYTCIFIYTFYKNSITHWLYDTVDIKSIHTPVKKKKKPTEIMIDFSTLHFSVIFYVFSSNSNSCFSCVNTSSFYSLISHFSALIVISIYPSNPLTFRKNKKVISFIFKNFFKII